ncbi:lipoprotein insertase outer membrane protein LolB [Hydrogenophaga sp. T2]|uniref:lipoprotein insertase outer membrane protein LolB n=1 Tax=Hydrogenophaga sp. T2 TaxID=3132823 RepID=UPI003CF1F9C6
MIRTATLDRRTWLLGLAALAGGCATPPRPVAGETWSGRLALRVDSQPPQAFSALFDLQGSARAGELRLASVLGQTLATVRWSPQGAELQRGTELTRRGSLSELTAEITGAPLPIAVLFDWLDGRGTEAEGWRADLSAQAQGRLVARREQPAPAAELRVVVQQP